MHFHISTLFIVSLLSAGALTLPSETKDVEKRDPCDDVASTTQDTGPHLPKRDNRKIVYFPSSDDKWCAFPMFSPSSSLFKTPDTSITSTGPPVMPAWLSGDEHSKCASIDTSKYTLQAWWGTARGLCFYSDVDCKGDTLGVLAPEEYTHCLQPNEVTAPHKGTWMSAQWADDDGLCKLKVLPNQ